MIDKYGTNLKRMVWLTKYIKTETLHYVAKKSKTFSAEQIHDVILHCMFSGNRDPKVMLYGVCIAVMYYGLIRMNEAYLVQVKDVKIVGEEDFKKIQINFDYQQKRKNNGFTYYIPSIFEAVRTMDDLHQKGSNNKIAAREVFGEGATFQNCSFIFHR